MHELNIGSASNSALTISEAIAYRATNHAPYILNANQKYEGALDHDRHGYLTDSDKIDFLPSDASLFYDDILEHATPHFFKTQTALGIPGKNPFPAGVTQFSRIN